MFLELQNGRGRYTMVMTFSCFEKLFPNIIRMYVERTLFKKHIKIKQYKIKFYDSHFSKSRFALI